MNKRRGLDVLEQLRERALQHPMSRCEKSVIDAVQAAHSLPPDE